VRVPMGFSVKKTLQRFAPRWMLERPAVRRPTRFDHHCATETYPPVRWRGKWFAEVMRLEKFLNMNRGPGEADVFVAFEGGYEEYDYNGLHSCGASVSTLMEDGTCYASSFESSDTCGIDRSLEQNCEGLCRNIKEWIFRMKSEGYRPDFPGSEPELELWLTARGI